MEFGGGREENNVEAETTSVGGNQGSVFNFSLPFKTLFAFSFVSFLPLLPVGTD